MNVATNDTSSSFGLVDHLEAIDQIHVGSFGFLSKVSWTIIREAQVETIGLLKRASWSEIKRYSASAGRTHLEEFQLILARFAMSFVDQTSFIPYNQSSYLDFLKELDRIGYEVTFKFNPHHPWKSTYCLKEPQECTLEPTVKPGIPIVQVLIKKEMRKMRLASGKELSESPYTSFSASDLEKMTRREMKNAIEHSNLSEEPEDTTIERVKALHTLCLLMKKYHISFKDDFLVKAFGDVFFLSSIEYYLRRFGYQMS